MPEKYPLRRNGSDLSTDRLQPIRPRIFFRAVFTEEHMIKQAVYRPDSGYPIRLRIADVSGEEQPSAAAFHEVHHRVRTDLLGILVASRQHRDPAAGQR